MLSNTGKIVKNTDQSKIKLDQQIKRVLACKPILSRILKEVVEECKPYSPEEVENFIEGDVQISQEFVNPGHPEVIHGQSEEDYVNGEGMVRYDIRTYLMIPGQTRQNIKILIDVEAQKDDAPGYSIPLRGLFSSCRMISSQLETEFTNSQSDSVKYGNLKKVYSIWICTETAQCRANTIEKYSIGKDFLYGYNQDEHRYDLMSTIIINISKTYNTDGCDNELICMLTNLFNKDMDADDKIRTLEQDYGIPMTAEIKEGVDSMCTYTEAVEQRGIEKGIKEGYDQAIFSLVQRGTISVEQGAQELKTDTDTFVRMMEEAGYKAPASV